MRLTSRRILLALAAVVIAVPVAATLLARPAPDHPLFEDDAPRPLVIAHQGGDGLWPGDTMVAFERAAELGVDMLEMDLHSTGDGVLVLMHDSTVDRTTDGTGPITGLSLEELKALDAGHDWSPDGGQTFPYRGQGVTVPTLEEVFQRFPGYPMNIEIKQAEPSITLPFCQMIRRHAMEGNVLVASFDDQAMVQFRQDCPEVATSASEAEVRTFYILNLALLGATYSAHAQAVQVPEYRGDRHILTRRFVDAAHGRNLEVHAWTINEVADMSRLLGLGVDGIITDYPDRLLAVLETQP